jgi:anti-anti-sigma factor
MYPMSTGQLAAPRTTAIAGPVLVLELVACGEVTVITARGEIDMSTAHLVTELVQHVAGRRPARVILDLAEVGFFCADGVTALILAREAVTAAGGQLLLRNPSALITRVLAITATNHLFPVDTA